MLKAGGALKDGYNYGADVRFSLVCYPGVAMLAGLGASVLLRRAVAAGIAARRAAFALAAALAAAFLSFMPHVRAVGEEAWAARADVAFARRMMPELPAHSIVLTQDPELFHLNGVSAAQMFLAERNTGYVREFLAARYAGGVFVHSGFWCNVGAAGQQSSCTKVLSEYPNELLREYREREFRYAFYRLNLGEMRLRLETGVQLRQDVTTR